MIVVPKLMLQYYLFLNVRQTIIILNKYINFIDS